MRLTSGREIVAPEFKIQRVRVDKRRIVWYHVVRLRVLVVVSKVEGLKSSYHFFVVYLFVCFYEGEICFRTCLTSIYLVLLYNYYYY